MRIGGRSAIKRRFLRLRLYPRTGLPNPQVSAGGCLQEHLTLRESAAWSAALGVRELGRAAHAALPLAATCVASLRRLRLGLAADRWQAGEPALQLGVLDQRGAAIFPRGQFLLADRLLNARVTAPNHLGRLRGRVRKRRCGRLHLLDQARCGITGCSLQPLYPRLVLLLFAAAATLK